MSNTKSTCPGADDPEERCPKHPSECTCWEVDNDHPMRRLNSDKLTQEGGIEAMTADTITAIKKALEGAEKFIVNGVELGYIRMPEPGTPDSAHQTLPMIRQAQTALESLQRENEEGRELARAFEAEANQLREVSIANRHRAEAAEAEVKRYRAALSEIATDEEYRILTAEEAQTVARTALSSTGDTHGN